MIQIYKQMKKTSLRRMSALMICAAFAMLFTACTYRDVGLDTWLILVDAHIHRQAVVEGVDAGLHRVALHRFIFVLAAAGRESQGNSRENHNPQHC